MLKKVFILLSILCLSAIVYFFLGKFGVIPMYKCHIAPSQNGPVSLCAWYSSPENKNLIF